MSLGLIAPGWMVIRDARKRPARSDKELRLPADR
jgi:hypothetical protein